MAMGMSKERIDARINRLKQNAVVNAALIKKWERKKRKYEMSVS